MERPVRKKIRLQGYDYNTPGYYFVTICTKEKQKLLCDIVGTGVLDGPQVRFTEFGAIADAQIKTMYEFYDDLRVDKYVVMPNHIHLLLRVLGDGIGSSGRPVSTDSKIARFEGTVKRFYKNRIERNIWQYRSYDHVIRGEGDYHKIWEYIDGNPAKWTSDCFYVV